VKRLHPARLKVRMVQLHQSMNANCETMQCADERQPLDGKYLALQEQLVEIDFKNVNGLKKWVLNRDSS
jgi:hypothetical protein